MMRGSDSSKGTDDKNGKIFIWTDRLFREGAEVKLQQYPGDVFPLIP